MTDKIPNPVIVNMLKEMENVFQQHDVDFYIVGAVARDIQLASKPGYGAIRATEDVDLAILLASEEQFYQVKEALLATGSFEAHPAEPTKLLYQRAIEVDLLPFGAIENDQRETRINKPKVFIMDMPGFQEAYSSVIPVLLDGISINVCSLEGIVLLKLIAYDDRPDRTKDISDIEHIIKVYFDLFDDTVYSEYFDVMELYDTETGNYLELVSARVIGRKIKDLLTNSPDVKNRMEIILNKRPTDIWQAILSGLWD
jgi:predicted nucleotidyltransferase